MPQASSRKAAYPLRFVGRHLQRVVEERIAAGEQASEAEVARWLGLEPSTFNRWINGYAHPRTEADWEQLTRMGLNRGLLRRLELLDKLDAWRRDLGLSLEEVANLGVQILTDSRGGEIFRKQRQRDAEDDGGEAGEEEDREAS